MTVQNLHFFVIWSPSKQEKQAPMPIQCRSSAYDAGPAPKQHLANASCLLSNSPHRHHNKTKFTSTQRRPSLYQHLANASCLPGLSLALRLWRWPTFSVASNTTRLPNTGLMLGKRRTRWANISPALGERIVFDRLHIHTQRHRQHERWEVNLYVSPSVYSGET